MLNRPVQLSASSVARAVYQHKLGTPHVLIESLPVWRDSAGDAEADARMWADFEQAGLLARNGRLAGAVLDVLALCGNAARQQYFGWSWINGVQAGALVAGAGRDGLVVLRRDDKVELTSMRNEYLAEEYVRLLGPVPAAPIRSVNVRLSELGRDDDNDDGWLMGGRPPAAEDAAILHRIVSDPAIGYGEIYVGVRDRNGRYRVNEDDPIRYRDTGSGRVFYAVSGDWLSVAPGTAKLLVERLYLRQRELAG